MAQNVCRKRLQRELVALKKNPVEYIVATPHEKNILEWHYVIEGPKGTVYEGGFYHGLLRFPSNYPYSPPSILMLTRSGRFKTNTRICLSLSDFHPESWNPLWAVSSILSGLLSFMLDNAATLGSIEMTAEQRRTLAARSLDDNVKNKDFRTLFPQYVELHKKRKEERRKAAAEAKKNSPIASLDEQGKEEEEKARQNASSNKDEGNHADSDISWQTLFFVIALIGALVALITCT